MNYTFDIVDTEPVVLAVAEARLVPSEVSSKILGLFDVVYTWLRTSDVKQVGLNYAVYDQGTKDGLRMRVGFPVSERFPANELVQCIVLEGGRAAHVRHVGPYNKLQAAYDGLTAWCAREGHKTSGESWEVYGHWHDDPSELVTDVYFRLDA